MIWYTTQEVVIPYQGTPLVVTATDRRTLEHWSRSGRTERRRADRARIVLGAAEGRIQLGGRGGRNRGRAEWSRGRCLGNCRDDQPTHEVRADRRGFNHKSMEGFMYIIKASIVSAVITGFMIVALSPVAHGQQGKTRLNKAIGMLEQGRVTCGVSGGTHYEGAETIGNNPDVDWIFYDMEHHPYDIPTMREYLQFLINPAMIVQNQGQNQIALVPRIPAYGREMNQWMIKQVLDNGAMGVVVPHLETAEQALNLVRAARYPQPYGVTDFEPEGVRGSGAGNAARVWGISGQDYQRKADSWPLDPDGELLIIGLIENQLGAANARDIARVPGISGLAAVSFSGDQGVSYRYNNSEIEQHIQTILAANKEFNKIPICLICADDQHG